MHYDYLRFCLAHVFYTCIAFHLLTCVHCSSSYSCVQLTKDIYQPFKAYRPEAIIGDPDEMPREDHGEEPGRVEAYSIKIPPFWPADPQVWFIQVEAQFAARGITAQQTKYHHIVASLSPEIATEIRDLLLHTPEDHPYDVLKQKLIERTVESEQRRLKQLLTAEELGDRKPTHLLRRMQQLLGERAGAMDGAILKELFMQRLPTNVRMVLASASERAPLEELATMADKIIEVATPTIATVSTTSRATSEVEQLRAENASLREQVSALQAAGPRRRRSSSRNRGRSCSPSQTVCWYHRRFGDKARKCTMPCAKAGNRQASE